MKPSRVWAAVTRRTRQLDFSKWVFGISCALVLFGYGVAVGTFNVFPYRWLRAGADAVRTLRDEWETTLGVAPRSFLHPSAGDQAGVTRYNAAGTQPGLTLLVGFIDGHNELRLIRPDGEIVRQWRVRFFDLFPKPEHIAPQKDIPKGEWNVELHGALALPDGSIVFNFTYHGLAKLDRCGTVQWTVPRMTHHSVEPAEGGGVWVSSRRHVASNSDRPELRTPYPDDTLLKISAAGEIIEEISIADVMLRSKLHGLLFAMDPILRVPNDFVPHANDVEELSGAMADRFPMFTAGDLVVSSRGMNLIMVVNPSTRSVVWHRVGEWVAQHDPDFQPNGAISLFNNNYDGTPNGSVLGGSNVVEIDPASGRVRLLYKSQPHEPMYTAQMGKHQLLHPSGNLLITESLKGRAFEVDASGRVVWEYVNRYDANHVATLTQATKYPEDYFSVRDWTCAGSSSPHTP